MEGEGGVAEQEPRNRDGVCVCCASPSFSWHLHEENNLLAQGPMYIK